MVMSYQVKLPVFEGPFEALFYLIQKAEVDIYEIPLARITDEYLDYLKQMEELNLEIASEFLVMAATLLKIKSQRLLPTVKPVVDEEEDDLFSSIQTQEDLIARMLEYKKFQEIARELRQIEEVQRRVYVRSPDGKEMAGVREDWQGEGVPLSFLFDALKNVLNAIDISVEEIDPEQYTVKEIMEEIVERIQKAGRKGVEFTALFSLNESRTKIILLFFALLELIRRRKVKVWQEKNFSMIYIQARQEG
jgi:segregation and condensation protein A